MSSQKKNVITFTVEGDFAEYHAYVSFGVIADAERPPQIRLSFSGIVHPFVVLAVKGTGNGEPEEYLVLAPEGEDSVYLLQASDERFIVETAILLKIERVDNLIQAHTEQQGLTVQTLEIVMWEHRTWEKLPVQKIELRRDEGTPGYLAQFERQIGHSIWKEANQQLAEWAKTAPSDGSFHRVQYMVDYGEKKDKFEGTYRLRAHDVTLANLGRKLRAWAAPRAGRWSAPVSPMDPEYSASSMRKVVAEHEHWLVEIAGIHNGWCDRYIQLLSHGELLDDRSVEPNEA